VAVFGLGVVGLLATTLLARHPLRCLATIDPIHRRRDISLSAGSHAAFDPLQVDALASCLSSGSGGTLADLVFELSGEPSALNAAIRSCGFGGRVVIGSWYGVKPARRIATAWEMIRRVRPARFITHILPVERAVEAYNLLDRRPAEVLQVVFTYGEG
jgi:alcohol dehydrogenase